MGNIMYTPEKERLMEGNVNYLTDDIRAILLMDNTFALTEQDAAVLQDIDTAGGLDEFDGSGYTNYAGGGNPLDTQAVTQNTGLDRAEFDSDDEVFGSLGAGTRDIAGILLYRHVDGTKANDQVVGWIDTGGFPFAGNTSAVTAQWNPQGIIQTT